MAAAVNTIKTPLGKVSDEATLKVLRRYDKDVESILGQASHVCLYVMTVEQESQQWERKNVEGTLYVVKRSSNPRFALMVLNRLATDHYSEAVHGGFAIEVNAPYLMYTQGDGKVHGIWFYDDKELAVVAHLLNKVKASLPQPDIMPPGMQAETSMNNQATGGDDNFYDSKAQPPAAPAAPAPPAATAAAPVQAKKATQQGTTEAEKQAASLMNMLGKGAAKSQPTASASAATSRPGPVQPQAPAQGSTNKPATEQRKSVPTSAETATAADLAMAKVLNGLQRPAAQTPAPPAAPPSSAPAPAPQQPSSIEIMDALLAGAIAQKGAIQPSAAVAGRPAAVAAPPNQPPAPAPPAPVSGVQAPQPPYQQPHQPAQLPHMQSPPQHMQHMPQQQLGMMNAVGQAVQRMPSAQQQLPMDPSVMGYGGRQGAPTMVQQQALLRAALSRLVQRDAFVDMLGEELRAVGIL